ncbi:MAG: M20/M25/M40 family metallo-hydrolase [Lachnospiraceae bacterium]|nr:M20/M25/M40 family metallo-hydrolase [Lachnospiraceae bacterium]
MSIFTEKEISLPAEQIADVIKQIKAKADAYAPAQLDLMKEFCSFDSETHYLPGNARAVEICKKHLEPLGVEFEEIVCENVGTHLIARLKPENPQGRIVLNSHLDTVFPVGFAEKYPCHVEGDYLYGLGAIDCKGGFVVSCYAVRIMQELGLLPNVEIDMIYSCDEEQGSMTGRAIYHQIGEGADAAFIFEPGYINEAGQHCVVTSRQGVILGNLDIKGVEAHAGCAYSQGHSANKELAHKILELYGFNDEARGIYYNAAPVSGGRPNGVVSGDANMQFCVAGIPDWDAYHECERNLDYMGSHTEDPVCTLDLSYRMLFPPQEHLPESTEIYKTIKKAADLVGMEVIEDGVHPDCEDVHGAGDANYFGEINVPALDGFGPNGFDMHSTEERVYIPSIQQKTELFAAYLYLMGLNL